MPNKYPGGCAGLEMIEPLPLGRPCCYVNCLLSPACAPALVSINSVPNTALPRPSCVDNKIIPRTLDFPALNTNELQRPGQGMVLLIVYIG